jgi:hypothetical protein
MTGSDAQVGRRLRLGCDPFDRARRALVRVDDHRIWAGPAANAFTDALASWLAALDPLIAEIRATAAALEAAIPEAG